MNHHIIPYSICIVTDTIIIFVPHYIV